MKKKKLPKTKEELAHIKEQRRIANLPKKIITSVRKSCEKIGLTQMELQLKFLKENKPSYLPVKELSLQETIECFEVGIEYYKEELNG